MRDKVDLGQIASLQATTALSSKQYSVRIKFKMCTDGDRRTVSSYCNCSTSLEGGSERGNTHSVKYPMKALTKEREFEVI